MSRNRFSIIFMLLVSILMLAVPVVPHHHHANGNICLRHDINPDDAHKHHQDNPTHNDDDPCCNSECATQMHTLQTDTDTDADTDVAPQHLFVSVLFYEFIIDNLLRPAEREQERCLAYIESLHSCFIPTSSPLRAPPTLA